MPAMPAPSGMGPSEYLKARAPVMVFILVLQTIVCAMRMVLLLDIMGGFIMGIAIGLGWYAWNREMHITFICYWGAMCLINGVFDLVRFIDHWVKSDTKLFSSELPTSYNLASFTIVAIPVVGLLGAFFAYRLYSGDDSDSGSGVQRFNGQGGGGAYGSSRESHESSYRPSATRSFQAFGGEGQRLGSA
eukprot:TRINITY_DN33267_c0_g1_i1.p1 TRINITY_DN33267_c0_g1~~TRINITY_DN33267_c0_g1_i1.p1  ORF type:complete len:219 (+),score=24.78 TRINITY_DN33267_c0_g1_i1:92-658(+)